MMTPRRAVIVALLLLGSGAGTATAPALPPLGRVAADTLAFSPEDDAGASSTSVTVEDRWLRAPIGDHLLTDLDEWRAEEDDHLRLDFLPDYNRVDRLRLGLGLQLQSTERRMTPRLGAMYGYSFGRERPLYGLQVEQPVVPPGRIAIGASVVRRTDHHELYQVEDLENSFALLFVRQDYRDYFERLGFGGYVSWRVPDFSTVSIHVRNDEYRSLTTHWGTRSFFNRDKDLRVNPAIDDGESHAWTLRFERLAHRTYLTRRGFYHWIELERSGWGMSGDFDYTRLLADLRSVMRLSPAATLSLRGVGGHTSEGELPEQKQFLVGGVDGLRGHPLPAFRGDQMLLGQAEYTHGLWRIRSGMFEGGLHAIAFVDAGTAWSEPNGRWDIDRQHIETDGGLGLSTSEDDLRIYVAKNLGDSGSDVVVTLRLHRSF